MKTLLKASLIFIISIMVSSCATYQDHYTLTETITTKVMIENLLQHATDSYAHQEPRVNQLQQQLKKMQLYENTKKKNTIMNRMWSMLNRESSSLQLFLTTWKNQGTMSPVFIEEYRDQITPIIDLMIDYESRKEKKTESALMQLLNPS
jgi:HD superfamily phosphohydrolase